MDQSSTSVNPVTPTAPVSDVPAPVVPPEPADGNTSVANPAIDTSGEDSTNSSALKSQISEPVADAPVKTPEPEPAVPSNPDAPLEVAKKIAESQNVLIALSSDPSVDELCAAIGLSLFLDKLGKRATAIYSGKTPNALEFLKPEETFESSTDTLQDFVIALNKEKADHLRYKLDGDYVKIFITPYKSRISSDDLEFSYGDFNIDLVLALDVNNGIDLDSALREHGRIMHDAVVVNITTGNPGRFGEIEWSDKSASSISEMIAKMLYNTDSKDKIEKDEATAFLTGIIAATNRFSNASTTPDTMQVASDLMQSGADQQLISKNITPDVENEFYSIIGVDAKKTDEDPTKLEIEHTPEEKEEASNIVDEPATSSEASTKDEPDNLLDDLKAVEASLAQAGNETIPETEDEPVKLENLDSDQEPILPTVSATTATDSSLSPETSSYQNDFINDKPEKVLQPLAGADFSEPESGADKYGKMLEDAIASPSQDTSVNPALSMAPPVADSPEINGVPEINYMPMPGEEVLPPPPTPPIDMSEPADTSVSPEPATVFDNPAPIDQPTQAPANNAPLGPQPAMQDQVYTPQAVDPGSFKIPGM